MFCGEAILVRACWVCKSCFFARKIEIPSTRGIIPVRTPVYKPFGPFGRTTIMVINHLLTGMIVQAGKKSIFDHGERNIMDPKEGYDVSSEQGMIPIFLTFTSFSGFGWQKRHKFLRSWESLFKIASAWSLKIIRWFCVESRVGWSILKDEFSIVWHMNQWLMTPSTSPEIRCQSVCPLTK